MITFYADENVDGRIVDGLRRRGVDIVTALEMQLTGPIDDQKHLEAATSQGRVLLTGDSDLLSIASGWAAEGRHHVGVIYWHPARCSVGHVVRVLHDFAQSTAVGGLVDRVTYVSWDAKPR